MISTETAVKSQEVGKIGEEIAAKYLHEYHKHEIIAQNYFRKWGEIDIVSRDTDCVHFTEVKTVSYETADALERAVTQETWRPEEMVHQFKQKQIKKAAETWLHEKQWEGKLQFNVAAVRIVPQETFATVNLIQNILVTE